MPRKRASKDTQSSPLRQPTLAGFINSKSASMASPRTKPQPTPNTTTASKSSKSTTSPTFMASTSKSPVNFVSTAEPRIEASTPKRGSSRRRSGRKSRPKKSPKKVPALQKSPSDSGDDTDAGVLQAIRFESQEERTDTGESTIELTSSSEDEEDKMVSPAHLKRTATRKRRASSGSLSDSDVEMIGGSAGAPRKVKRRLKRRLMSSDEEDPTETEGEEEPSPKKRRLVKGLKPSTSEEEINLMDEVDEDRVIAPRLRTRDKRTAFQRSLETLKRQRSGLSVDSPGSSEGEDEEDELLLESPRTKRDFFKPFAGSKPSNPKSEEEAEDEGDRGGQSEEEGEGDEDSWIVEDDGLEGVPELPTAFNMSSHQDLSHHFKIICQLFVHLAVRSPSQRVSFIQDIKAAEDDYFYAALSTVRRKIMGMRDSLITSSTWQTKFKRVLERFPVLSMVEMDFVIPGCDACNLGARMSKVVGRVSGQPYDHSTFEPIEDSDSGENSESDQSEDEEERPKKQMHLGRFCAKRTKSFHEFTHWEWKLFNLLSTEVRELRSTGKTGYVKVAFARGIRAPKDLEDADGITDWLDQRGIFTMAWTEMKQMMERARKLESFGKKEED